MSENEFFNERKPPEPTTLREAIDPFRRALQMLDKLPKDRIPSDDRGLREALPGVWPTIGELRTLIKMVDKSKEEIASLKRHLTEANASHGKTLRLAENGAREKDAEIARLKSGKFTPSELLAVWDREHFGFSVSMGSGDPGLLAVREKIEKLRTTSQIE